MVETMKQEQRALDPDLPTEKVEKAYGAFLAAVKSRASTTQA